MKNIYLLLMIGSLPIWILLLFLQFVIAIPFIKSDILIETTVYVLIIVFTNFMFYWLGWINRGKIPLKVIKKQH